MNDDGHDDGGALGSDETRPDDSFFDDEEVVAGYDDESTPGGDPFSGPTEIDDPFEHETHDTVRDDQHVAEEHGNVEDPTPADDLVTEDTGNPPRLADSYDESPLWLTASPSSAGDLLVGIHDDPVIVVWDTAELSSVWAGERHGLEPVAGYVDSDHLGDAEPFEVR